MDQAQKHVCGVCHDEWLTEAEYLAHTCPNSGFTPEQAEHLIATTQPEFAEIQKAALTRGLETVKAEGDETKIAVQQEAIEQLGGDIPRENPEPEQPLQLG